MNWGAAQYSGIDELLGSACMPKRYVRRRVLLLGLLLIGAGGCGTSDEEPARSNDSSQVQAEVAKLANEQLAKDDVKATVQDMACARTSDESNDYKCLGGASVNSKCTLVLSGTFTADGNAVVGGFDVDDSRCEARNASPESIERQDEAVRQLCREQPERVPPEIDCSEYE